MALNIKNEVVETLVEEVAQLTGETKTEAVRRALAERLQRLRLRVGRRDREQALQRFLEREIWANVPPEVLGTELTREEEESILGFGPSGA